MSDLPDYELRSTPGDLSPPTSSSARRAAVAAAIVLVIAAAGAAFYFGVWTKRASAPAPAAAAPAAEAPAPSAVGTPEPVALPALDASDGFVNTLVRGLSSSPAVAAWLATNGLIRNFTVVTTNIADGATPAKHLKVLRPPAAFQVAERGGRPFLDPRSYDRYTTIADAVASVDPAGAAKLYGTLKPLIDQAYRELVSTDQSFDGTLERAIVVLLNTPVLDGPVPLRLRPKGIAYGFDDERIENLRAAQKQLLRMGPRNVRTIQSRLREIALALGIPAARLPAP